MKQSKIKKLTNVELLNELPFYSGLNVKEIVEVFKRYAKCYNIEIVDKKDSMVQLYLSKLCIKDLFKVLLYEMKDFKYQITLHVTLKKNKLKDEAKYTEYAGVYLNSFVKIVINENFEPSIDKSFEEILYRLDNWINEGSGWIIESINSQYLNISTYIPLLGNGDFIELPKELNNPKKCLINIRNNDYKCFLWCHVRHLNPANDHSTRIKNEDKRIADTLNYANINFPVFARDYDKIEDKNEICLTFLRMKIKLFVQFIFLQKVLMIV